MPAKSHTKKKSVTPKAASSPLQHDESVKEPIWHTTPPHSSAAPQEAQATMEEPPKPEETSKPESPPVEPTQSNTEDFASILANDSQESGLDKKNNVLFFAGITITVLIMVVTACVYVLFLRMPKMISQAPVTREKAPIVTPTPTVSPSGVTFEVLNGSGTPGAATKAAKQLSDKGYTVVATGNAKRTANTQLFLSPTLRPDVVSLIVGDISNIFGVASNSGDLTGSSVSARLIIGTK